MRFSSGSIVGFALLVSASVLAACQGNIGGGSGLSIPQAPGYQQPGGPSGAQTQSRERVLDGAVYLSTKLTQVPLPVLGGFSVSLALGTPGPIVVASPAPSSAASGAVRSAKALAKSAAAVVATASPSAEPSPSAVAGGSAAPSATNASASPGPSGSPAGQSTGAFPSAKPSHSPSASPSGVSTLPRIDTKLTVYPDDAPPPPTPMPTGEVQTFVKRVPLVRGYVKLGTDVPLYGLGAVHFTLPSSELTPKRGFTIAIYQSGKHNHNKLMNYDTEPSIESGVVYSSQTDPIVLKKDSGYLLMIYGDESLTPAGPATVAPGFPSPGNNPFPYPTGSGYPQPQYTQVPGYGSPTPYPGYATPTPFGGFGTPHP